MNHATNPRWRYALLTAAFATAPAAATALPPTGQITCAGELQMAVLQGPSSGLSLRGELVFSLGRGGDLVGEFVAESGRTIALSGQANGQLIGLTFDLGNDQFIWGTGTGQLPVPSLDCGGLIGGTFAGPQEGDIGNWRRKGRPGKGLLE